MSHSKNHRLSFSETPINVNDFKALLQVFFFAFFSFIIYMRIVSERISSIRYRKQAAKTTEINLENNFRPPRSPEFWTSYISRILGTGYFYLLADVCGVKNDYL